jgi:hypothetical protein
MKFGRMLYVILALTAGASSSVTAAERTLVAGDILTAIDVIEKMQSGYKAAGIAQQLSEQRGYDRASSLSKGDTDETIIRRLIINTPSGKGTADVNISIHHENQGDSYLKELQLAKAAQEYTLAIYNTLDNYDLFKSRADTYKMYLKNRIAQSFATYSGTSRQNLVQSARKLLCDAMISDYGSAQKLVQQNIRSGKSNLDAKKSKMNQKDMKYDSSAEVVPFYNKPAQKTLDMRQLGKLRQTQRSATQANAEITSALSESRLLCTPQSSSKPGN